MLLMAVATQLQHYHYFLLLFYDSNSSDRENDSSNTDNLIGDSITSLIVKLEVIYTTARN